MSLSINANKWLDTIPSTKNPPDLLVRNFVMLLKELAPLIDAASI
jgi:hypothetical protein